MMRWVFFLTVLSSFSAADAADVSSVVKDLQAGYRSIRTIEADFEQVYRSRRFGDKTASGRMVIEKPDKMRWDYRSPEGKVFVTDGSAMTYYDPADRQAIVGVQPGRDELPVALSLLWGEKTLEARFDIELESYGDGKAVLRLLPKEPIPNVRRVYLTVRTTPPQLVTASRVIDALGEETELTFREIRTDVDVGKGRFDFAIPKGVAVVPMRSGSW